MNGENLKPKNETPMIYTPEDFITPYPMIEEFIKELADLYNKYGIDSKLNMRDFLLAEMSYNFLAVMHNTMRKEDEMRDDIEGKALLYANKTAERTKRAVINKVVNWLGENLHNYASNVSYLSLYKDLKQAMQDESK
jgi:hypothetical protein